MLPETEKIGPDGATEELNRTVESRTFRNIGYNSIARILTYITSAASSIVLGRCLLASDYGIVSFAFIFINFMDRFADIGIGSALVQRKVLDETTLYTAFTLKFIIGVVITAVTFVLSGIVSTFTNNPDGIMIVRLLSLCFLFNNISFIPNSLLTREMNFKKISIAESSVYFVNSGVAIILALRGYGYWSIVAANLVSNFTAAVLMALFRPVKVRFRFDSSVAKKLVDFGGYLFLSGLFSFLIANFDNFIVGVVKGAVELGYYAIAFNWGSMVCLIMYSVVLRVILPVMSKLQDKVAELKVSYLKTLEYSSYFIVLVNVSLFVVSREFLVSILSHGSGKWLPALAALRILCLYGILRGLLEPIGQVIVALGKTKVMFKANLVASVIEVSAIYPALKVFGIEGVAGIVTVSYLSQYVIYYYYLKRAVGVELVDLTKAVRPSFLAASPVLLLNWLLSGFFPASALTFFVKSALSALIYIVTIGVLTDWEVIEVIKSQFAKKKIVGETAY